MLIDANVFNGYYQFELNKPHALQGCPSTLLQAVTVTNPLYHDVDGIIEHEWRSLVDRDWFDTWLANSLQSGCLQYTHGTKNLSVESQLKAKGFPPSRDVVYVRVGLSVSAKNGTCNFFTEDLDFYDPKMKNCNSVSRKKILAKASGPVPKILSKHGIKVCCVP